MTNVPVFYATTEGHTQQIAEVIASTLREQGFASEAVRLSSPLPSPDWSTVASVVVGASLHAGRHQPVAKAFVTREAAQLNRLPAAFFSVSLGAASRNPDEVETVRGIASRFVREAGWQPRRIACLAGKLAYTQYGFFTRWFMKRIAAREGGPTDASRDHDLTDWKAVREFALGVAEDARRSLQSQAAS